MIIDKGNYEWLKWSKSSIIIVFIDDQGMPHIPLYASEQFRGKSERGLYGDVIEEIDHSVCSLWLKSID